MKEPLLSAVITNESEPPVANETLDRATRHPSLLGHTRMSEFAWISILVPWDLARFFARLKPSIGTQPAKSVETNTQMDTRDLTLGTRGSGRRTGAGGLGIGECRIPNPRP